MVNFLSSSAVLMSCFARMVLGLYGFVLSPAVFHFSARLDGIAQGFVRLPTPFPVCDHVFVCVCVCVA